MVTTYMGFCIEVHLFKNNISQISRVQLNVRLHNGMASNIACKLQMHSRAERKKRRNWHVPLLCAFSLEVSPGGPKLSN
uniref:Uncharacterized protein n=1 Tax=Cucumis melo TaxID=3656 RepID=A0A9I9EBV5_CUCME